MSKWQWFRTSNKAYSETPMKGFTMNAKNKLVTVKNKIKTNAPLFIAAVSSLVAVSTVVYYKTKDTLDMPTGEDLEVLKSGASVQTYDIDGSRYDLTHRGNTPEF